MQAIFEKNHGETFFFRALLAVFVIRLFLAAWIPITGDEAYFILWGKNPDYGFYDHTPMVGWFLAVLLTISDANWWLRLPAVVLPIFLAWSIYRLLKPRQPQVAAWVALVYLLAPVNVINFLITTDTPLIFFSFLSALYFYHAVHDASSYRNYIISGLFLGLAFFSKYFAVFLGISYGLYLLIYHRNRRDMTGLLLILLMVIPFALLNLWWNYNHCWNNILFNLFNRTADIDDGLVSLGKYVAMLIYLFSPFFLFFLFQNRDSLKQQYADTFSRIFLFLGVLPLLLFFLLVSRKEIGLHWVFSFYPFVFIAAAGVLNLKQWRWTFHFMWVFSLLHLAGLSAVMLLPEKTFSAKAEAVQNLVFGKYPDEVLAYLKPYERDYTFATVSYGLSSVAAYHARREFIVFSKGSYHAREDERLTDYRKLDGKNILVFKLTPEHLDGLKKFFVATERKTISVRGTTFELLLGKGFKYDVYRQTVLTEINREFYSIPEWLPVGQCEFKQKYGFSQ